MSPNLTRLDDVEPANFFVLAKKLLEVGTSCSTSLILFSDPVDFDQFNNVCDCYT